MLVQQTSKSSLQVFTFTPLLYAQH